MKQGEERKVGHYSWLYGVIAGGCVAAMQIGVGLLQVEGEFAIIMGAAQGLLVCSLTVICGSMMEWLLTPLPIEDEDKPLHPGRERIREYGTAFRSLADSFLSPSARLRKAVPYSRIRSLPGSTGHALQNGSAMEYQT